MKRALVGIALVLAVLTLASFFVEQVQEAATAPASGAPPLTNPLKIALLKMVSGEPNHAIPDWQAALRRSFRWRKHLDSEQR